MGEGRNGGAEGGEDFNLGGGVGDVILTTDDVGDGEGNIIHHRWQGVEIAAVFTDQDRIGKIGGVDLHLATQQIVPAHPCVAEPEAPMGFAPLGFQSGAIICTEFQTAAVIDRRALHRDLAFALAVQFLRRFVGGIKMAGRHQPRGGGIVIGTALALPGEKIMGNAEPGHVGEDGRFIFGL